MKFLRWIPTVRLTHTGLAWTVLIVLLLGFGTLMTLAIQAEQAGQPVVISVLQPSPVDKPSLDNTLLALEKASVHAKANNCQPISTIPFQKPYDNQPLRYSVPGSHVIIEFDGCKYQTWSQPMDSITYADLGTGEVSLGPDRVYGCSSPYAPELNGSTVNALCTGTERYALAG